MEMRINAKPLYFLQVIDFDTKDIKQVYKGKLDNCRCGCGGDYFKSGNKHDDAEINIALSFLTKYAERGEVKFERFKYSDPSKNELYLEFETDIVHDYDNGFDESDDDDWYEEVRVGYGFYIKDIEK